MKLFLNVWMVFLALLVVAVIGVSHGNAANDLQHNWQKSYNKMNSSCIDAAVKGQEDFYRNQCE